MFFACHNFAIPFEGGKEFNETEELDQYDIVWYYSHGILSSQWMISESEPYCITQNVPELWSDNPYTSADGRLCAYSKSEVVPSILYLFR